MSKVEVSGKVLPGHFLQVLPEIAVVLSFFNIFFSQLMQLWLRCDFVYISKNTISNRINKCIWMSWTFERRQRDFIFLEQLWFGSTFRVIPCTRTWRSPASLSSSWIFAKSMWCIESFVKTSSSKPKGFPSWMMWQPKVNCLIDSSGWLQSEEFNWSW